MNVVTNCAMCAAPWVVAVLTLAIFVLDLLTPLGLAISPLYVIPLLLTFFSARERDSLAFSLVATILTWSGVVLKPPGTPISYAVFNRAIGTLVLWGVAFGVIRYRRTQQALRSERIERSHAEGLMIAAQEARAQADAATLGAVTGRRQLEQELLVSRLRLDSIVESAMDAIITIDESQHVVLFNQAASQMFGCPFEQAIGKPLDQFLPQRFREAHRHHVERFSTSGVTNRRMGALGAVTGLRANGEEFPIEAAISHVCVEGKQYSTVVIRDISERARAEQALRESEERLRLFIEHAPTAIAMFDREMRYLAVSRRWIEEYRLRGDIRGCSHYDVVPEVPDRWKHAHQRGLAGEVIGADEDSFVRRDGSVQWLRWEVRPWHAADATIGGIIMFTEDITERKRTQAALEEGEERFRQMAEAVNEVIWITELESRRVVYLSPAIERIWGRKPEEFYERHELWLESIHPEDRQGAAEAFSRWLGSGGRESFDVEYRIIRPDGTVRWIHDRGSLIRNEEGRAYRASGIASDITERKHLQEQLRRTERLAELGTLASGMAHEIGTPMNVILGRAEHLMQRATDERTRKGLEIIVAQVERITKIMNQLLSMARRKPGERRVADLRKIIDDCVEVLQERWKKHRIQVIREYEERAGRALVDSDHMSQVLLNLLLNADHAMPDGGTLRLGLRSEADRIILTVADTGHGIPKDTLPKIFTPFFTTKEIGKGTGLGLAVVHGIIEEHHGSILVDSEVGKGTTFTISLPVAG